MPERLKKKLNTLDDIVTRYDDAIGKEAKELRSDYGIFTAEELDKQFCGLDDAYRLLRIGIIGKVKAGKSSLLNAVFFNGENVLPKAATPMTASLTLLTWGDACSATVDYFTAEDIKKIKDEDAKYEQQYRQAYQVAKENAAKKGLFRKSLPPQEVEERARRAAERSIADESLKASHDQYRRMRQSPRFQEFASGKSAETLSANDRRQVMRALADYVGADGALMPFTKSVELRLPQEALKDIVVVDTPGLNDPVVSRSERTNDYLSQCDVVFIVSPAGQFVSLEDTGLMDRLSTRQGVRELYLVASQADNQLFGNAVQDVQGDFHKAIRHVERELADHAREVLSEIRKTSPETAGQFDELLSKDSSRIIITSSVCSALARHYDAPDTWDEMMRHIHNLLKKHYADYFDNKEAALANLGKLDGISRIAEAIKNARQQKDGILAQRRKALLEGQTNSAKEYADGLTKQVQEKITQLESTDLAAIQTKQKNLRTVRANGTVAVDEAFDTSLDDFRFALRDAIDKKRGELFAEAREGVSKAEDSETRTRSWTTGMWWWKKRHSEDYQVTVIRAGAVRNQLNNLRADLEQSLLTELDRCKIAWKKNVQTLVTGALRKAVNDDDAIDINATKMAMRRQVNSMEIPELDFSACTFDCSDTGKLEGSSAESYLEKVQDYLSRLRNYFQKQTGSFIQAVDASVRQFKMSDMLFGDINTQIDDLEQSLRNKQANIQRLTDCLSELEEMHHV